MKNKKKICFFTGSRAEYGLLKPLMEEFQNDVNFKMQILVSGMHLSPEFGLTYNEIEKDFKIDKKVEMLLSSDTPAGITKSIGLGIIGFADAIKDLKPDILIVLGDRFETLAVSIAAFIAGIPLVHLYGGELTEGVFDDAIRHSITKMSCLHFTSTEEYRKRIIQLGEQPDRIFNVGSLGLDNIKKLKFLSKSEIEKELNFSFKKYNLLITFHPVTLEKETSGNQFLQLLKALDELEDNMLIFTKANADTEGRLINKMIDEYVEKNKHKSISCTSMGQILYLSTMKYVNAVVGNSSSGIIETPSLGVSTINIGNRQKGRIKAKSIIDCPSEKKEILKAIKKAISKEFKEYIKNVENPYGDGNTAKRIKNKLKNFQFMNINKKSFYNINIEC